MANATNAKTNTAAETAPAKRRGRRPATETGRVAVDLGVDTYAKLDDLRWELREDSVADLVSTIVTDWLAKR